MFVNALDPVLLQFGNFQIRYYGLVWGLGFLLAYYFLNKNRDKLELNKDDLDKYLLRLILGVFIGARLVHVLFSDWGFYSSNLLRIFYFWEGGVAFHGGLIGAAIVTHYFFKKRNVSFFKIADVLVIPAVLALALGRIANFINGELWGVTTDVSWCVQFLNVEGCRHPTQIYESMANFLIFGILFFLSNRNFKNGVVFWSFILLMGVSRFLISFLRVDDKFLMLSDGQWFSLVMIIVALYYLWRKK
jgi:phosphatidylglycerol---prolipoprotein diacylglyceryl transferase